jgi:hypothetical protein
MADAVGLRYWLKPRAVGCDEARGNAPGASKIKAGNPYLDFPGTRSACR